MGDGVAAIGDDRPELWSEELQRSGRVVFTLRPRPVLGRLALLWLVLLAIETPSLIRGPREGEDGLIAAMILLVATAVGYTGWCCWRLVTHHPALTVDHEGIRVGRKRFVPWAEVNAIGGVRGSAWRQTLPIVPTDSRGKELVVPQLAVRNLPALARWLENLHKEQRVLDTRRNAPQDK